MKPSDLTPYVWNRILQAFDGNVQTATAWLAQQTHPRDIWGYLLEHEGIIGYEFYLHQLHQHLWHANEVN